MGWATIKPIPRPEQLAGALEAKPNPAKPEAMEVLENAASAAY
jgi:hypothetical protein